MRQPAVPLLTNTTRLKQPTHCPSVSLKPLSHLKNPRTPPQATFTNAPPCSPLRAATPRPAFPLFRFVFRVSRFAFGVSRFRLPLTPPSTPLSSQPPPLPRRNQCPPKPLSIVLSLALCSTLALTATAKDLTIATDGSGDFKTLQPAIDSIPADNTSPVRILIKPGTYVEYLNITKGKNFITLIGQGQKSEDTILAFHYKSSDQKPDGSGNVGTTGSSSTTVNANDFTAQNITFSNTAGDKKGQAVALKTNGDRLIFDNCRFLGFQDTLYPAGGGRCYFKDCYITGNTDFIFGNATAVFDHCTINSTDVGWCTAANTSPKTPYGYVFLDCTLTASDNVKPGTVYLGRPWQWNSGSSASVTYIRTKMGPHINPLGWHPWDATNTTPGDHSRYSEFGSMDSEGKPPRHLPTRLLVPPAHRRRRSQQTHPKNSSSPAPTTGTPPPNQPPNPPTYSFNHLTILTT